MVHQVAAAVVLFSLADRSTLDEAILCLRAARRLAADATAGVAEPSVALVLVGLRAPPEEAADAADGAAVGEAEARGAAAAEGALYLEAGGVEVTRDDVSAAGEGHELLLSVAEALLQARPHRRPLHHPAPLPTPA